MKRNLLQFLAPVLTRVESGFQLVDLSLSEEKQTQKQQIHPEFNNKDYLSFLLHIDAEIEHGLMVQYLYSAYSLSAASIPEIHRLKVTQWQEIILGIAKEEMGHLITVQNVLRLIGASLNFNREDYPWDTPFYPFPFMLEPLTQRSLAKYVYAEAPETWLNSQDPVALEVSALVKSQTEDPHAVGMLFKTILDLVSDSNFISDKIFQEHTYPYQAKFDEWGRGYSGGNRGNDRMGNVKSAPNVLVMPLTCRDDAINAIRKIAEQGEDPEASKDAPSHFERFLGIYNELKTILSSGENPLPTDIVSNPVLPTDNDDLSDSTNSSLITHPTTKLWAHLFNVRYRMLLNYLQHSFLVGQALSDLDNKVPRGLIINSAFGEMYNLRSLAHVIFHSRLNETDDKIAGPTFTIPYSLDLPMEESNRWRLHHDLLIASKDLIVELLYSPDARYQTQYLNSLLDTDQRVLDQISQLTLFNDSKI